MCDVELPPGDHIEPQAFFFKYKSQSSVQEGFGSIDDKCVIAILTELLPEFAAHVAKGKFIEKIQGRAELFGQLDDIAAADEEMAPVVYLSGKGKDSQLRRGSGTHNAMVACNAQVSQKL